MDSRLRGNDGIREDACGHSSPAYREWIPAFAGMTARRSGGAEDQRLAAHPSGALASYASRRPSSLPSVRCWNSAMRMTLR